MRRPAAQNHCANARHALVWLLSRLSEHAAELAELLLMLKQVCFSSRVYSHRIDLPILRSRKQCLTVTCFV